MDEPVSESDWEDAFKDLIKQELEDGGCCGQTAED
jgi:hypothetical protein